MCVFRECVWGEGSVGNLCVYELKTNTLINI